MSHWHREEIEQQVDEILAIAKQEAEKGVVIAPIAFCFMNKEPNGKDGRYLIDFAAQNYPTMEQDEFADFLRFALGRCDGVAILIVSEAYVIHGGILDVVFVEQHGSSAHPNRTEAITANLEYRDGDRQLFTAKIEGGKEGQPREVEQYERLDAKVSPQLDYDTFSNFFTWDENIAHFNNN